MNLANKLTMVRIYMTLLIIFILVFPFDAAGISIYKIFINEALVVDIKYIISGVLFVMASITDFLDGYVARKYNMITDFGKTLDAIADKVLVNSVLIILTANGFIPAIIPVIVIGRDAITNAIKMIAGSKGHVVAASKLAKVKTMALMVGITLTLFHNLPFELMNLKVSDFLLVLATILSVVSGVQYYDAHKNYFTEK